MICASSVPCGSDVHSTPGPLAAQPAQRLVHGDPRQPGREAGVAAKLLQMREGADIGFLHDVLGLAVVAQDAAGEPVQPAIVRLHDRANRRLVAGKRAADQFGIVRCRGERFAVTWAWRMTASPITGYMGRWMRQGQRFRKIVRNMAARHAVAPGGAYGNR